MSQQKPFDIVITVIRILVGMLFIFSGLIKANDPSGLAYKMMEFFEVWSKEGYMPSLMDWLNGYALPFSILMITFEIVAGIALIIGYRFRLFAFLILALTIFFTFLTSYAVWSGKIKECGCFGDCIKLQANESFMKDVILLGLILVMVIFRKRVKPFFAGKIPGIIMISGFLLTLVMQWYALKHLPFKDCLAYKKNNNILKEMTPGPDYVPAVCETMLTYEKGGVKKDFTTKDFPWQDSNWKYVDSKTKLVSEAKNEPAIKDFSITNYNGEIITNTVLTYEGYVFLLFVKDVKEAQTDNMDMLRLLVSQCKKAGIPFLALSASNDIETNKFKQDHQLEIEFCSIDGTVCKTAMRTNPGLMLIKNGTVMNKWSYRDYPEWEGLHLDIKSNSGPLFPPPVPVADTAGPPAASDSARSF